MVTNITNQQIQSKGALNLNFHKCLNLTINSHNLDPRRELSKELTCRNWDWLQVQKFLPKPYCMQSFKVVMIQAKGVYEKAIDATIFKLVLPLVLDICRSRD